MKKFVAIQHLNTFDILQNKVKNLLRSSLKQHSLIFDQIGIINLNGHMKSMKVGNDRENIELCNELEWLVENQLIFNSQMNLKNVFELKGEELELHIISLFIMETLKLEMISYDEELTKLLEGNDENTWLTVSNLLNKKMPYIFEKILDISKLTGNRKIINSFFEKFETLNQSQIQIACFELKKNYSIEAVPIVTRKLRLNDFPQIKIKGTDKITKSQNKLNSYKSDVLTIGIKYLPLPKDSVSWEQILDFRKDEDSKSKFLALRNWMHEIARGDLSIDEIEDKLEYLTDQYEKHMNLHKMKYHKGLLETIITTTAEVVENLTKLKFSQIAQLPFSLGHKKIAFIEEELKAPGKEVAYISKARQKFS